MNSSADLSFHEFETALGSCAIAWSPHGICALQLPGPADLSADRRLATLLQQDVRHAATLPADVDSVVQRIAQLLETGRADFDDVLLDLTRSTLFQHRVYDLTRKISPGQLITYGQLADRLQSPPSARAVGHALSRNPIPLIVPCHRVVRSDGGLGGFSAFGGIELKRRLLVLEAAIEQTGASRPKNRGR